MTIAFKASDHCLLSVLLERPNTGAEDDRSGVSEILAAMDVLAESWIVPLGVSALFVTCDPSDYFTEKGQPANSHQFIRVDAAPAEVRLDQTFADPVMDVVPRIDATVLRAAVTKGLTQPTAAGLVVSLSELWWTSVRVRSPVDDDIELAMPWPTSAVTEVIDGARWCFGPTTLGVAGPPVRLRGSNSHFATQLLLEIFWDIWRDNPPGRALVDAGVQRVLARGGWEARQLYPEP